MITILLSLALISYCAGWRFTFIGKKCLSNYSQRQYQFYAVGCWLLGSVFAVLAGLYAVAEKLP